jgi:hypothetical protein
MSLNDTFAGAAGNLTGHTSDSGHTWTAHTNAVNLSGAGAAYANSAVPSIYTSSWVPAGIDLSMTFTVAQLTAADYAGVTLCFNGTNETTSTYYYVRYEGPTGALTVAKVTNNAGTTLATYSGVSPTATIGVSLSKPGSSNVITITIAGVVQTAITDTSPLSAGQVGTWLDNAGGASAGVQLDSMTASDVLAAATSFTMTGPTRGPAGAASTVFTLTPVGGVSSSTVTPTAVAGATFTPASLTWAGDYSAKTFTVTRATAGTSTIAVTSSGTEAMPGSISYTAVATTTYTYAVVGGTPATSTTYAIKNLDGTDFSAATATGVADTGGGSYSVSATVPADYAGTIVWAQGSVLANDALQPPVMTGVSSSRIFGGF